MAAELLDYPAVGSSQLQLSQLLGSRQTELAVSVGDQNWHLSLHHAGNRHLPDLCMDLEISSQPVQLFMGKSLLNALLPDNLDIQAVLALPRKLMLAALQHILTPVLGQLQQTTSTAIEFLGLRQVKGHSGAAELLLTINIADTRYQALVATNPTLFELLKGLPPHLNGEMPDIPIWASLELGRTQLSREELGQLESGDIVFLKQHVTGQQLIIRTSRSNAFLGEANGTQITVKQRVDTMDDEAMDDQPVNDQPVNDQQMPDEASLNEESENSVQEGQAGVNIADINVDLLFEIGRQQLSADQLQALEPGFVFELDRPIEQPVRIRANGKLIAECQLVQIDNRLGARITSLNK
ncbi:MAG: type III secretion system cytoplasmic ring protein SctQ [Endozoicomonas sp.]